MFQINAIFLSVNPENIKCFTVSTKIMCSTTVFNIDNNHTCFLSRYYYDFCRSCDTEDWSNDAENTEINYSLTHKNKLF